MALPYSSETSLIRPPTKALEAGSVGHLLPASGEKDEIKVNPHPIPDNPTKSVA